MEEFKKKLKEQISGSLPGEEAHLMMMPTSRDDELVLPTFKSEPMKSAVLILFFEAEDSHLKFPLIQRPTYTGAHSGQIAFPGGKAEYTDPDLTYTALREAHEEIGVDPGKVEVAGNLSDLLITVSNFIVTPVIGFIKEQPDYVLDKQEVESVLEADLYDLLNPGKRKEGEVVARGKYRIRTPYFEIEDRIVWGATAMMLSELSIVVGKTGMI
jgi:8-oxo-dGTP pyrophosphatase MutT (NUDIX family)